jgi:DNA topoisomerase-3
MAERGLGTPATRAQTIEGLLYEGYIVREGRDLKVTAKGLSLITLLRELDAATLTKAELTGEWEHRLRLMERGQLSRATFMADIRQLATELVEKVKAKIGSEVGGRFEPLHEKCPRCGGAVFNESFRAFECANPECKLIVWKIMSDREFEREEVATLLREGRVGPLEGFKSKFGKPFAGPVILSEATEWKQKFDFGDNAEAGAQAFDPATATELGDTPHGKLYETETAYLCVAAGGKPIRMGKAICQRAIPADQALKIFREGKSDLLPKFISKKGKPFSAYLKLEDGKVNFEFAPREKKPAKKKAAPAAP